MPQEPKISIITAVRNGATTISDCLESIRRQLMAVEHVVVDGCSSDCTLDLVRTLSPQARILSEPDCGIYDAMNKGISLASGDIVGILNADDFYPDPDTLSTVAAAFGDPQVDACYGDLVFVRDRGGNGLPPGSGLDREMPVIRYWKAGTYDLRSFYWGWMPPHPTFFVRRSVYERYGRFKLDLGSAADYELMLRFLLKHRVKARYIPQVLVRMRMGGASNASWGNRLRAHRMDRKAWKVNGLTPHPWTLLSKPLRKVGQFWSAPPVPDGKWNGIQDSRSRQ